MAKAKIDMRLVPNQKPEDIFRKLKAHLEKHGFGDIEIEGHNEIIPSRTPIDHPALPIIVSALRDAYGLEPIVFPGIGGAGPNYVFTDILEQPCFVVPHATHDQANHAPNESMDLAGYLQRHQNRRARLPTPRRSYEAITGTRPHALGAFTTIVEEDDR